LKDSNAKTRDAAYVLIVSIASRVGAYPYLTTVAAALAAETSHMRSAAVMAFSRVVFEFAWDDEELQSHLPSLLSTVLALIDEDSREVIKSVVGFVRICVAAIPSAQLQPLAGDIVSSLLRYQTANGRFRGKTKIILKKLVKAFGYDYVGSFVPSSEAKLLSHMKKEEQRQKRKKETSKQERPTSSAFDDLLDSDEEGSGDERTLASGATGFSKLTGRKGEDRTTAASTAKSRGASKSQQSHGKKPSSASILIPNERDGEIVDMLGASMSRRVKFAEDQANDDGSYDDDDDVAMEFDDDGKLVVIEDDNVGGGEPRQPTVTGFDESSRFAKRRRIGGGDAASRFGGASVKSSAAQSLRSRTSTGGGGGKLESRSGKQQAQPKQPKHQPRLGAAYRSKRSGGDVKRKDQALEPYAYVPLDGRSYSKKNRRAAVEQMSSVVRSGGRRKHVPSR
jgi:ribosomal RNA-processing protein 12